jgi:uncharacterized protein (TIGR01244 family)
MTPRLCRGEVHVRESRFEKFTVASLGWNGMNRIRVAFAVCLSAGLVSGCASHEAADVPPAHEASAQKPPDTEKLEPYSCGSIQRMHTLGGVFLASQPAAEDLQHAKEGGIKTVVDLRKPEENRGFDEPKRVQELGLTYVSIPFQSPEELTPELLDRARAVLNDDSKKPILLHCSSANRVGAVWLAHRIVDGGLPWDQALAEAKTVGLKLPAYEDKVREYLTHAAR